jgi:hypothetical protein
MRAMLADYAIPKKKLLEAQERDLKFSSSGAVSRLNLEAVNLFTDLTTTGEGGEMLLYLLAERFLKMPLVICKMDLKTDKEVHYHGADGVYSRIRDDGVLKLYWGESKIFDDITDAVRECLRSLAPFLLQPDSQDAERERDILLLNDKADLKDPTLTEAFRRYFDKTSPKSNKVQYCGVALVGFAADFYPAAGKKCTLDDVVKAAELEIDSWIKKVGHRIKKDKLEQVEIDFLFVPLPAAQDFRDAFLKALGIKK